MLDYMQPSLSLYFNERGISMEEIHYEVWDSENLCEFAGCEPKWQGSFPQYSNAKRFVEGMANHFGVAKLCFDIKQVNSIGESHIVNVKW